MKGGRRSLTRCQRHASRVGRQQPRLAQAGQAHRQAALAGGDGGRRGGQGECHELRHRRIAWFSRRRTVGPVFAHNHDDMLLGGFVLTSLV